MLKVAGPAVGLSEDALAAKSKEGKQQIAEKNKREAAANLKKHAGNKAFINGKFEEAVKYYTEAIAQWPENHLLYRYMDSVVAMAHRQQPLRSLLGVEELRSGSRGCRRVHQDPVRL